MNAEVKIRIEKLNEYLKNDPGDIFSNYALALEYIGIKRNEEAILLLEKILKLDENYLAAYYQLGKSYESVSRIEEARQVYKKGIQIAVQQNKVRTKNELQSAIDSMSEDE